MMDSADNRPTGLWRELARGERRTPKIDEDRITKMNLEKSTKFFNFSATDKYYKMQLYILKLM